MDPDSNQDSRESSNPRAGRPNVSGYGNPPVDSNVNAPNSANAEASPQATPSASQQSDGFTTIQPNESRWSKLKMMAQKEEEDFQRWKEENRPSSILLTPERLGGNDVSLAEARERQLIELRQSKLQKKVGHVIVLPSVVIRQLSQDSTPSVGQLLKKEDMDRRRRQEEEDELQKMRDKQREKAERLEERSRREELQRRQQLSQDQLRRNDNFLQKFEWTGPAPVASNSATHTSSWHRAQEYREVRREEENTALQLRKDEQRRKSEALGEKQREEAEERRRDVELEHRRVNSAFLDQLEGRNTGRETEAERERGREVEHLPSVFEKQTQISGAQDPLTPVNLDPESSSSDGAEEPDEMPVLEPEPDYDWAVMKLHNRFPFCEKVFLEDILLQCNGDYAQAYALLSGTLL